MLQDIEQQMKITMHIAVILPSSTITSQNVNKTSPIEYIIRSDLQ